MVNSEEFILSHAVQRVYDPVKAHDYYVRNRKLKGRQPVMAKITTTNVRKKGPLTGDLKNEDTRDKVDNQGRRITPLTITERRQAEVRTRITALRGKLTILKTFLNQLISEAQSSSSSKTSKKSSTTRTKSSSSDLKDRKALTGTQKKEKAKKARNKYRKEHPESEQEAKDREREQKIEKVKQQIEQIKSQLKAALDKAREISGNNKK